MSDAVMPEVEYEVWQDGDWVAGSNDRADAEHYLTLYGQDGPVEAKTSFTYRVEGFTPEHALAASTPVGGWEEPDEQDVLDTISDAIGDSMDLDWTYSIGAKAIIEAFKREGWTIAAPPPPSVSTGSRPQEAVPTEQTVPAVVAMYVPMPLDADGNGPAGPDDIVRVEHQVWDAETCGTLCTAPDEGVARWIVSLINTTPQPADGCSSNEGADGWIEHDGGPNPVPGQRVDVRWRDGEVSTDEPSRDWCWKPTDGDDTIIAYRLAGSAHD